MPRRTLSRWGPWYGLQCGVALACAVGATPAAAQNKPFPQGGGYAHGFLPSTVSARDAQSSYDSWRSRYVKDDCGPGTFRVEFGSPKGSTVSEGQGYGMVLAAYFADRNLFDGLWAFVQKNVADHGLMGWKVTCSGFVAAAGGAGSATDGDADIGLALVAAVDQWGDAYRKPALDYLAVLKRVDFTSCPSTRRAVAKAGNWGGGCDRSNTSYFTPGYDRVFQAFTGDPYWGKAADDAVALWLAGRNPKTGLDPDEVDENGVAVPGRAHVNYNGCRIPWRAVLDYLWYGTPGAKDVTDRLTDWAQGVGISNLVDGYELDGRPSQEGKYTQLNAWVGAWACGAMSRSQGVVDSFAADFKSIANDNGGYYGASLRTLYLLTLSGNFWRPGTPPTRPTRVPGTKTGGLDEVDAPPHRTWDLRGLSAACGCDAASRGPNRTGAWAVLLALGSALVRRRRLRCTRHPSAPPPPP